jgi:hypothetical protein
MLGIQHRCATVAAAVVILVVTSGCPSKSGAGGGAPSATATPTAPASEAEWSAVRVDPTTYAETEIGVVAISDRPPFQGRFVSGDAALQTIIDEMNALDHVMSTGLSGPGTKVMRNEDQYFRIMRGNWLDKLKGVVLQVKPKTQAKPRRFRAFYNKDGKNAELGLVAMKPSHYLQIIESKPGEAEHLFKALREVNGSDGLSVDIPPPAGAPRGSYGRGVERGTPLFFTLMRDKLLHRESVVLIHEAHSRPAELHHVERTGAGLAQLTWLKVDIDKMLSAASKLAPGEQVRYEDPSNRLAFIVERYTGTAYAAAPLSELVKKRFEGLPGFKAGPAKPVEVAARELLTVAFRTGSGDAATDHAVTLWPHAYFTESAETPLEKGLLIHVTAPAQGDAPDATSVLGHAVIARSIESLYIDPEWAG